MSAFILPFAILIPLLVLWRQKSCNLAPLPPGPPRLPVLGNLFNAPKDYAWKTYLRWRKKYNSDILYLNVFGTHIVVLNSQETANDLLVKRSRLYSSRPSSYMASCLIECDWFLACMPYNDAWRVSRRLLAKYLSRSSAGLRTSVAGFADYEWQRPHVVKYTHYFLLDVLRKPNSFLEHIFRLAASVSVSSSHGLDISAEDDVHITLAKKAGDALKNALSPGRFWIDVLPLLKFAPEWVSFKQLARSWNEDIRRFLVVPFTHAKENLARNDCHQPEMPSIVSQELKKINPMDQRLLQEASAAVFVGTTGTTSAVLNVFFLAMTSYPDAQKRAQAELDSLLKKTGQQLPTHADLQHLPYCMAVVYEVLRWQVVGPIGLPHLSTAEDVYKGYRIPKGSVIIANIWAMMRDPVEFEDPSQFRPERFLNADGRLDVVEVKKIDPIFGFGRRACVGRSLALSILSYAVCCVLAVFDVQKKLDDQGEAIEPRIEFDSCITSSPLPFVCSIKPRSPEMEKTILELFK